MTEPSDQPSPSAPKPAVERASFWPPLIFIGSLFLAGYVLTEIEKESPGSATEIVRWAIGIAVVAFVGWLLVGSSLSDIAAGTRKMLKGAAILIAVVVIFGPLTKCTGGSQAPTDIYYRR